MNRVRVVRVVVWRRLGGWWRRFGGGIWRPERRAARGGRRAGGRRRAGALVSGARRRRVWLRSDSSRRALTQPSTMQTSTGPSGFAIRGCLWRAKSVGGAISHARRGSGSATRKVGRDLAFVSAGGGGQTGTGPSPSPPSSGKLSRPQVNSLDCPHLCLSSPLLSSFSLGATRRQEGHCSEI